MASEVEIEELIRRCNKFAGAISVVAKNFRELGVSLVSDDADMETAKRRFNGFGDAFSEMSDFWMELYTYVLDLHGG